MSVRNKLAAVVCGLALAGTVAMPVAALADQEAGGNITGPNTGTTEVTIQAAKSSDGKDQLSFSVPTVIPFAVTAKDGTLVGPSASTTEIKNLSVFPIHVANMSVDTKGTGWNLVSDASKGTGSNLIAFSVTPNDSNSPVQAASSVDLDSHWNMGYAGSGNGTLQLATAGKVARVTADLSKAQKVGIITWTLAAGNVQ